MKPFRKVAGVSDLWFSSHNRPSDFYLSSWQPGESATVMLVIRIILAALAVLICTWSVLEAPTPYWLAFLTNWGVLLLKVMTLCGLAVSIMAMHNKVPEEGPLPWYVTLYWLTFNVGVTVPLMVSALYYILLFDPEIYFEEGPRIYWLGMVTHGFTSCLALVELIASRTPVYLLHFYQPLTVSISYAIFSFIYYAAGGTDQMGNPFIYSILDWREPRRTTFLVVLSGLGLVLIYVGVWALSLGRDKLSSYVRTTSKDLPYIAPDV